jgi:hypothetical protein
LKLPSAFPVPFVSGLAANERKDWTMATITKRKGRDRGVSWGVRVRVNGYATLSKTLPATLEAQRWAALTEAAARGRTLALSRDATLADLIDEYTPRAQEIYSRALVSP